MVWTPDQSHNSDITFSWLIVFMQDFWCRNCEWLCFSFHCWLKSEQFNEESSFGRTANRLMMYFDKRPILGDSVCTSPTLNMKPSLTWAIEVNTTLMSSINLTQFNLFLPAAFSSSWAGSDTRTQAVVCILHTAPNQPTLWLWNESHTLVFHWCHQCVHSLQWALCSVAKKK